MKPLGVGVVCTPALLPLLRAEHEVASVIEVEPQTLWQLSRRENPCSYLINGERLDELASLPQPKILHSVGLPVGSSRSIDSFQVGPLRMMVDLLDPPWLSEHLSFNGFGNAGTWTAAGFLLPPLQSLQTVTCAAMNLRTLADTFRRPVAFENGVNYLRVDAKELSDGEFFRSVAEAADCGILLDLHNLWTNECNGRERADQVLAALPLARVWEVHLAGGMRLNGYWLDSHSASVPEPVLELAAEWLPRMPNLGALIFEILDDHIEAVGLDGVLRELDQMRSLWSRLASCRDILVEMPRGSNGPSSTNGTYASVQAWEHALGSLVIGREPSSELAFKIRDDPGVEVLRGLVGDSRSGFIAEGLRYTMSLPLRCLGAAEVNELLADFMLLRPPELFVSAECDAFANFLKARSVPIPFLDEVLSFEHALIRAVLYGEGSTVNFEHDLAALFESLDHGQVPHEVVRKRTSLVVRPG
jgi:uncharacterized protein (UPF0276 family)